MRKIRLKKDKETLYGINIGLAIFTLISLGILIYQYRQGNNTTIGGIRLFLFVHLILQIIFSLFWLPYVIKRKIALKKGREVECRITAIKSKKINFKSALRNFQFNYMYQKVYYIQVKYELDGKKKISILDDYGDDPSDYLPYDYRPRKYKLYIYGNELFLQNLYFDGKKELIEDKYRELILDGRTQEEWDREKREHLKVYWAELHKTKRGEYDNKPIASFIKYSFEKLKCLNYKEFESAAEERCIYSFVKSQTYIICYPQRFKNENDFYAIFMEVYMRSPKKYKETDFDFQDKIKKYLDGIEPTYTDEMEAKVKRDITQMVRLSILKKNHKIVITEVKILIRKWVQ